MYPNLLSFKFMSGESGIFIFISKKKQKRKTLKQQLLLADFHQLGLI